MTKGRPFGGSYRDVSPCKDCNERFTACQMRGKCPKDKRGEYGYAAWRDRIEAIDRNRKTYNENIRNYKQR